MAGQLALFDLDNTLLAGDSDHAWGEFLIDKGLVDAARHRAQNDKFYAQYLQGKLDIHSYVRFTLQPILSLQGDHCQELHAEFMREVITPLYLTQADALVAQHRAAGDITVIVTATNEFITRPIAARFQVTHLLATALEIRGGRFTGNIAGTPCYQTGKVDKLLQWLESEKLPLTLADAVFYSDSINDLPLLERVAKPVVVDPDDKLRQEANARGWEIISLR